MRYLLRRGALFIWFACLATSIALGQTKTISGVVTDASDSRPLPGVNVLVVGSTHGAATDIDGNYTVPVSGSGVTLRFSYVGYLTLEVEVGDRSTINVALEPDIAQLEDVVVVGYGTQRREDITSSVSSVNSDDFIKASPKDAASLIAGKVAGLAVTTASGDPTAGTEINIRGTTTLMASSAPLVLIDGVPGELNTVAPEDIESIDVLKDGSAAAVYGSRGSNGVILITTRKYRAGDPLTIRYDGYFDYQQISKRPDFLTADDYRSLIAQGYAFEDLGYSTDWISEVLQNPVSHTHNLSFSGGNFSSNYTASVNYRASTGILLRSNNEEITGRLNVGHQMFDNRLSIDLNLLGGVQNYWTGGDGYSFNTYVWRQALIRNQTDRVKDEDGKWQEREGYFYDNPLAYLHESDGENEDREIRMNGSISFNPIQPLTFKLLVGTNRWDQTRGYAESFKHISTVVSGMNGYASRGLSSTEDKILELTGTFENTIGKHEFNLLGGYSYQDFISEGFWMNTYGFPTDLFGYNALEFGNALTSGKANINSDKTGYKLIGFISRLNYNYDNRYILMGSARYEGNSKFGADHKWGLFPAVSAGWRMSQEPFLRKVTWIDDLKLRAGYGVTGIAPTDPYQSLTSYAYGDKFFYNGEWVQGIEPARNPNPDLRWERKEEINLGLDFAMLNSRLSGSVDVYQRNTKDMLWNYDVPVPPYLYGSIMANVGEMRNEGIEIQLNLAAIQKKDFRWMTSLNYSTNSNKLVSLSNELYETTNNYFYTGYTGEPIQLSTHRVEIGGPIGDFYGYESVDIDDEGKWIVLDSDGNRVSIEDVNEDDRRYLGNGIPNHYLSWNNTVRYKQFDLSVNMRGAFDFQVLNFQRMFYENPTILQYNMLESAFDKVYGKTQLNYDLAYVSYYVEDGDYWKIDNVTLGYTLDRAHLGRLSGTVSNVRLYLAARNLYTITGYKGMDPEVSTTGLFPGNDERDKYPTTRTFTMGLNLTF